MRVEVDYQTAYKALDILQKQVPFAMSKALNRLAKEFQSEEQNSLEGKFTLRRRSFVRNTIKIERGAFATKRKLYVDVGVDRDRDFLAKFEKGGTKRPRSSDLLSVPIAARPNEKSIVPKRLRRSELRLSRIPTKSGRPQFKGPNRVFEIQTSGHSSLIFQRQAGPYAKAGGDDPNLKLLYLRTRFVPLPGNLRFYVTAQNVARRRTATLFAEEFNIALRTAKLR